MTGMITKIRAAIEPAEALAVIGAGLFIFGIWQIYHPAAYLVTGIVLVLPFVNAVKVRS